MSDGKTHYKVYKMAIAGSTVITGGILLYNFLSGRPLNLQLAGLFVAGEIARVLVDPDIDSPGTTLCETRLAAVLSFPIRVILAWRIRKGKFVRKREREEKVTDIFTIFVKIFYAPFAFVVPHRHITSHAPVLADIIIWSYTLVIGATFYLFFYSVYQMLDTGQIIISANQLKYSITNILRWIFSYNDLEQKVFFLLGSSYITLSHLVMDQNDSNQYKWGMKF